MQTSRDALLQRVKEAQGRVGEGERPKVVVLCEGIWQTAETGKVFVPDDVRGDVLKEFHDSSIAGHPGIRKTIDLIGRNFW